MPIQFVGWLRTDFKSANWRPVCNAVTMERCRKRLDDIPCDDRDGEKVILRYGEHPVVPRFDDREAA